MNGRLNEGALCFQCANRRREALGLAVDEAPRSHIATRSAPAATSTAKKVTVNNQKYTWELTTLDSLIVKWKERQLDEKFRTLDASWWLVVVNDRSIPAADFSSVPISDGDEISIVLGRGRYF
jgi:sulfur carrier protein ThiS